MRQSAWEWFKKIWSGAQHVDFAAAVLGYLTSPKGVLAMSGASVWGVLAYFDGLPWSLLALYVLSALVLLVFLIEALIRIRRNWAADRPEIRTLLDDAAELAALLLRNDPFEPQRDRIVATLRRVEDGEKYIYRNDAARRALIDFVHHCAIAVSVQKRSYDSAAEREETRRRIHEGPLTLARHLGLQ